MMLTTGGVTGAMYGSLMRIQRGWAYRYQYRVIVGIEMLHRNLLVMERTYMSLSLCVFVIWIRY